MCGITGFTSENKELIRRMCEVLQHRGPDDEGYYFDSNISLGSRRLSIIDLKTGHQPIYNEDQSIVVVHNGEIYNFLELRNELERRGHRFYTNSDTEVIVHSYEEWGETCTKRFNGMFAFAIWDANEKKLLLARDRCGIKPLYYAVLKDGTSLFASEIKAILQHQEIKREVDLEAFHYYVNLRFVPKEKTLFKGINKLLPGHLMTIDKNGAKIERYWEVNPHEEMYTESWLVKKLQQVLIEAVKRHLISDVPLGILLSGGIDSSTIVALASEVNEGPIRTFTMGFGESNDETEDALYVADFFGTKHEELVMKSNILKDFPEMIWYADMPKRNLYPFYIAREASKHVKVSLSGLGGDELFGGYEWKYQFAEDIEAERKRIPGNLRTQIKSSISALIPYVSKYGSIHEIEHLHNLKRLVNIDDNVELYLSIISLDEVFHEDYLPNIYSKKLLDMDLPAMRNIFEPYFNNELNFIEQTLLADFKVKAPDDFLFVDDAMSMANSVESRVPFFDNELVEFMFSVPATFKYRDKKGKYILKKAMSGILPERVLKKEKQGFGGNVGVQFSREIYEWARQILPEGYTVKEGFIKKKYIDDVLTHKAAISLTKHYIVIWDLLAFEIWYRMYILNDKISKPKFDINSLY